MQARSPCFALFLDDAPPELQYPEDQARFTTLAAAHVDLVNKLCVLRLSTFDPGLFFLQCGQEILGHQHLI
jgi:hypothetical protein